MDEIIKSIISMLQVSFPSYKIIYGKVTAPVEVNCPFICVYPQRTPYDFGGTRTYSRRDCVIGIRLTVHIKDYFSRVDKNIIESTEKLVKDMEERGTNGKPKATTILGTLEADLSLGGKVNGLGATTVEYEEFMIQGSYFATATVTLNCTEILPYC